MRGEAGEQRPGPRAAKPRRHGGRRLQGPASKSREQPRMPWHMWRREDLVDERLPSVRKRPEELRVRDAIFAKIGDGLADRSRNHDGIGAVERMRYREGWMDPFNAMRPHSQQARE